MEETVSRKHSGRDRPKSVSRTKRSANGSRNGNRQLVGISPRVIARNKARAIVAVLIWVFSFNSQQLARCWQTCGTDESRVVCPTERRKLNKKQIRRYRALRRCSYHRHALGEVPRCRWSNSRRLRFLRVFDCIEPGQKFINQPMMIHLLLQKLTRIDTHNLIKLTMFWLKTLKGKQWNYTKMFMNLHLYWHIIIIKYIMIVPPPTAEPGEFIKDMTLLSRWWLEMISSPNLTIAVRCLRCLAASELDRASNSSAHNKRARSIPRNAFLSATRNKTCSQTTEREEAGKRFSRELAQP